MALIDCPECGASISDRAPACPKCGFPMSSANGRSAGVQQTAGASSADTAPAAEPAPLATERSAEPFRIAGRRVPIAGLLFWGGMVVGVSMKPVFSMITGSDEEIPQVVRSIPYYMMFGGMLWFAVTNFTMLIRNRKRRTR